MFSRFTKNITPHVVNELDLAEQAKSRRESAIEFEHLENAHVLGQESTYWHTKVHWLMLVWAVRNKSLREFFGQAFRIVGALLMTAIGFIPQGNTGGANISPFKPMALKPEHSRLIQQAKADD